MAAFIKWVMMALLLGNTVSGQSCDVTHTSDKSGTITSPDYPDDYPANIACEYMIHGPPGSTIELTFILIDIESDVDCDLVDGEPCCDYLKVYDGETELDTRLATICGTDNPASITSTSNNILLKFTNDDGVAGKGFQIDFNIDVCSNPPSECSLPTACSATCDIGTYIDDYDCTDDSFGPWTCNNQPCCCKNCPGEFSTQDLGDDSVCDSLDKPDNCF